MELDKARILLAVSDAAQAARLSKQLDSAQMTTVCRDAQEVLRELRTRPYDVLIAPFAVRGADALWLMERICAMREISVTPSDASRLHSATISSKSRDAYLPRISGMAP